MTNSDNDGVIDVFMGDNGLMIRRIKDGKKVTEAYKFQVDAETMKQRVMSLRCVFCGENFTPNELKDKTSGKLMWHLSCLNNNEDWSRVRLE